ncbi:MAG: tautomerase family protein [Deltaproteobacteria bacterium]|nr:tautomerase family protein [Deltaproteobacteria bacterium]MBT8360118.1 tautomerase family protein [Deltaproteobacteria bacterium]NNK94960.1 tautomerase family protein [Desulfobacterales bacterium]
MPLVNISILRGKSPEYIKSIADGVNLAVLKCFNFPSDDRYQIIHEHEIHCLEMQERVHDRVMMHVIIRKGHSDKAKQSFYKEVTRNLSSDPGIDPANILIAMTENHDSDWSFRDGLAQFII